MDIIKKKTELVKTEYYTCRVDDHRHRTHQAAASCVSRTSPKGKFVRSQEDRDKMTAMKDSGQTYKKIGAVYGLSSARARDIVLSEKRRREQGFNNDVFDYPTKNLSTLAKNIIICTASDIGVDKMSLFEIRNFSWRKEANCGIKTLRQIHEWADDLMQKGYV
jgi:hypothetical protein